MGRVTVKPAHAHGRPRKNETPRAVRPGAFGGLVSAKRYSRLPSIIKMTWNMFTKAM